MSLEAHISEMTGEERPRVEYVELLSIRNKFVELRVKEAQRDRAEAYVTKKEDERKQKEEAKAAAEEAALAPRPISDEGQRRKAEQISELLHILKLERVDKREWWWRIGAIMKTELGDAGFPGWVAFSKRSTKFDLVGCEREWKQYAPGKGLTMASLVFYATEDDPAATLLWKQKWCKEERSSYQICQGMQQGHISFLK